MGIFDFFKSKPKSEIETLAISCIHEVESGTEAKAKQAFAEMTGTIKTKPALLLEADDISSVGKALFIIQFMGIGSSKLAKNTVVNLSYLCLSKAIQIGNKKTDSANTLLLLLQQSHSYLESSIRKAIATHNPTTDKEVKESLTKIMYYVMKSCPGAASGNQQALFMESSLDSMILNGRLGADSTISSVKAEGQKYFNWLRVYIEKCVENNSIATL